MDLSLRARPLRFEGAGKKWGAWNWKPSYYKMHGDFVGKIYTGLWVKADRF